MRAPCEIGGYCYSISRIIKNLILKKECNSTLKVKYEICCNKPQSFEYLFEKKTFGISLRYSKNYTRPKIEPSNTLDVTDNQLHCVPSIATCCFPSVNAVIHNMLLKVLEIIQFPC